jgi:hypothetical protein
VGCQQEHQWLGVIADNLVNIGRAMSRSSRAGDYQAGHD